MKKDDIKDALQAKLGRVGVTPPDGMWERLDGELAAMRREGAFGGDAQAPAGISVRRPIRRRMNWAYAVASFAAAAVIMIILFSLNNENNVEAPVMAEGIELVSPIGRPVADPADIIRADAGQAQVLRQVVSGILEDRAASGIVSAENIQVQSGIMAMHAMGDEASQAGANASGITENAYTRESGNGDAVTGRWMDTGYRIEENTSDMEVRGGSAPRSGSGAESAARTRRAAPIATSLFAVNTGGINTGGAGGSGAASTASFLVNDLSQQSERETSTGSYKYKHKLPLTFGISVGIPIMEKISIQTGITYSYLQSEAESSVGTVPDRKYRSHYLGIPVSFKYDFAGNERIAVYVGAGGMIEKCISAEETILSAGQERNLTEKIDVNGVQFSVGANLGVELKLDRTFGIYLEPGMSYYFDNDLGFETYRSANPLTFTLRGGVRINL